MAADVAEFIPATDHLSYNFVRCAELVKDAEDADTEAKAAKTKAEGELHDAQDELKADEEKLKEEQEENKKNMDDALSAIKDVENEMPSDSVSALE